MFKWFWGDPVNPGKMQFRSSTLLTKSGEKASETYVEHEIGGMYGAQIGRSFFGRVSLLDRQVKCYRYPRPATTERGHE